MHSVQTHTHTLPYTPTPTQLSPPLSPPASGLGPVLDSQVAIRDLLSQRTPGERLDDVEEEMSDFRAELRHLRSEVKRLKALVLETPCATPLSAPASPVAPASPYGTPRGDDDVPTIDLSQSVARQMSRTPSRGTNLTVHQQLKRHTQVVRDRILARRLSEYEAEI